MLHWRGDDPAASVYLSQRDVRELQFAKASIATGWAILVAELGVAGRGHLAGAAGRQLRRLPDADQRDPHRPCAEAPDRCASSRPATSRARARRSPRSACASAPRRESIVHEVEYVELSGRQDFNDLFIDQLAFPG